MKKIRYFFEFILLKAAFFIFSIIPLARASNLGGAAARFIGPRLAVSRKAKRNMMLAMPQKNNAFYETTLDGMWENLGRVMAEYPHLKSLTKDAQITGLEHYNALPPDRPFIVIGAHLANWEVLPWLFNDRLQRPVAGIYRAPNNARVAALLQKCRNPDGRFTYIPKSLKGSRAMIAALQGGQPIALLIDQKFNQGITVPFFGRGAKTSTSFIQLAKKYDCPVLPVWIARRDGVKIHITIDPPLTIGAEAVDGDILSRVHARLEQVIQKTPQDWLWLHRRWVE